MEKKLLKKLLIVLTILMIISTDFVVLGTNLISYAVTNKTTNNDNIEFSTYFKNENGEKVEKLKEEINSSELKLYAEVAVKKEGYFNGCVELTDANFKLKNEILSSGISKIEGNKVTLKQINAGSTVEIELAIEPITSEIIKLDKLNMASTIKLTGTYMENTYKGLDIEAEKQVNLELVVDSENTNAELTTEILTNKVFAINGTNKRIVQLLVKSNLTNNNYPIKQTTIKTTIPELGEKTAESVKILTIGTEATNGLTTEISEDSLKNENGIVELTIKNEVNENGEISWKKDVLDQFILTFTYAEDVDASKVEFKTNSEIQIYNAESKFTAEHTVGIENQELNNIITTEVKLEETEMYKGQLYANVKSTEKKEIPFSTTTSIEVRSTKIADTVKVKEEKDVFVTDKTELDANTRYISTSVNKDKMIKLLGENGFIEIKVGQTTHKITKDSEADESGNIVINYESEVHELEIITSEPTSAGRLEFNHSKAIMANSYTTEQIRKIKGLKAKNTITALLEEKEIVKNTTEQIKEIKETSSQVELTINKQNLSTMTVNNEFIIGVKLLTDDTKYDLYKNPTIRIQLPQSVENIEINSFDKLYADAFELERAVYNKVDKTIEISLKGEQLAYTEKATQLYLQINANITLSKTQPSKADKITMEFTNENAIPNVVARTVLPTGTVEQPINIVSPSGLITFNNIETYNIEGITGTSQDKQLATVNKNTAAGTDAQFKIALVNNTQNTVNNVKILGNFPTEGEFVRGTETIKNNFVTTLKSAIVAQNCTIYYSANMGATADTSDTNNGWTTNLSDVTNPKAYLIEIASMEAETNFEATYTVQLPTTLEYELTSYTGYQVLYNEGTETVVQKAQSPLVGLTTGEGVKLETTIEATVGNETLKDGDKVKNGEVIKYKITATNNGTQNLENVVLKGRVPTGTVLVVPEEDYVYSGLSYYAEQTGTTEFSYTIPNLQAGQTYSTEYEVRVNMDTTSGTELTNKSTALYGDFVLDSKVIKNVVEEAKIRVTIKRTIDESTQLIPGMGTRYLMIIDNISNESISNLKMQIITENVNIVRLRNEYATITDINNEITITEIPANGSYYYHLNAIVSDKDITQIKATINITDSEGNKYRSNQDIQKINKIGAEINLSTPNDGAYVEQNEEIIYNIILKNTGEIDKSLTVENNVSEYLEIKEIYEGGVLKFQTDNVNDKDTYMKNIANDLNYFVVVKANSQKEIKIVAKVKEINEKFDVKYITNSAKVLIDGEVKGTSEEVKHILKGAKQEVDTKNIVSGMAWLDTNHNGQKDAEEKVLSDVKVKLFDISKNSIAKDEDGKNVETTTNKEGQYTFTKINKGNYIVIFEYEANEYELTTYMAEGVPESQNSNAILKTINIDGQEKICAVTDTINVSDDIFNINIGLKELLTYDMELNKYISRIVVQNAKGTKAYDYKESTLQKVEIHKKQLSGSVVILEYTIRVKNTGEIAGYVTSIKDYLPSGLEFNSELNSDWYLSGENLYTKSLSNTRIEPGESKDIKLILTKTMTDTNTGLINNRAEIIETYNEFGKLDIDSVVNNESKDEDDLGAADVIISISTGGKIIVYTFLVILNTVLIAVAIYLIFIKNRRKRRI